jgi:hypothetical protein
MDVEAKEAIFRPRRKIQRRVSLFFSDFIEQIRVYKTVKGISKETLPRFFQIVTRLQQELVSN